MNHFGWQPSATKAAVILGVANASVELRSAADDSLVDTFVSGELQEDEDSGDQVSVVDFSSHVAPGEYYLVIPSSGGLHPAGLLHDGWQLIAVHSAG